MIILLLLYLFIILYTCILLYITIIYLYSSTFHKHYSSRTIVISRLRIFMQIPTFRNMIRKEKNMEFKLDIILP